MHPLIVAVLFQAAPVRQPADTPKTSSSLPGHAVETPRDTVRAGFAAGVGYGLYAMKSMNGMLIAQNNAPVHGGPSIYVEFQYPIKVISKSWPDLLFPALGVAVLEAGSTKTFSAAGGSATVHWTFSPVGVYVPIVAASVPAGPLNVDMRPVMLGAFSLGSGLAGWLPAGLTVDDRPGRLAIGGNTFGTISQVSFRTRGATHISVDLSYRWIQFNNVGGHPSGGWTNSLGGPAAFETSTPFNLDYSGVAVTVGVATTFAKP